MLNTAVITPQTARPGPTSAPDPASPGTQTSTPFSQALGQASAQQRESAETRQTPQATSANDTGETDRKAAVAVAADRKGLPWCDAANEAVIGKGLPNQAHAVAPTTDLRAARQMLSDDKPDDPVDEELVELAELVSSLVLPRQPEAAVPTTAARETAPAAIDQDRSDTTGEQLPDPNALMSGLAALSQTEAETSAAGATLKVPRGGKAGALPVEATASPNNSRSEVAASAEFALPAGSNTALAPNADPSRAPAQTVTMATAATVAAAPSIVMQRPNDSAMPFQAELSVALRSPEFAPALGTQLSVLVRDGIEHAQLKLNPADLGPIDVRISLEGDRARVDFSAAHAVTRQILQDAVPALASTLRESGLTLTGGGVFDQARDPRGDARPDTPQAGPWGFDGLGDSAPSSASAPRLPRARGVVDLYA